MTARRRLYKPERPPARTLGVIGKEAPISVPDASRKEVAMALYALCKEHNFKAALGNGYDALKDKYFLTGKSVTTGKAQDIEVEGAVVGETIRLFRMLNGGPAIGKRERHDRRIKRSSTGLPHRV